jgi:hypothetical protein
VKTVVRLFRGSVGEGYQKLVGWRIIVQSRGEQMPSRFTALVRALAFHQPLLRDLLLILVSCVICFLYFNEQWLNHSQTRQQQALNALAAQLASNSYVPLASGNLVSLNVLTRQLASQPPVVGARIERLDGGTASSAGLDQGMQAAAAISDDAQQIIGKVVVYGTPVTLPAVWPFVLLLICLLGVRVAFTFFWHQLQPLKARLSSDGWRSLWANEPPSNKAIGPGELAANTFESPTPTIKARIDIHIINYERLQQRFTPTALQKVLDCYDARLQQVADIYGFEKMPLVSHTSLELHHVNEEEALFMAACAASLFRLCCEQLDEQRRAAGEACLSFSLLLSIEGAPSSRAGHPPFALLLQELTEQLANRLHCRLVEQWQEEDGRWQLLALDGLAERYQKLMAAQLASLVTAA